MPLLLLLGTQLRMTVMLRWLWNNIWYNWPNHVEISIVIA
jgi:hypothetical protein